MISRDCDNLTVSAVNFSKSLRIIRDEIQNADDGDYSPLNDFLTESMSKVDEIEFKKNIKVFWLTHTIESSIKVNHTVCHLISLRTRLLNENPGKITPSQMRLKTCSLFLMP